MKKLVVISLFFCFMMLGMMTGLSAANVPNSASSVVIRYDSCIEKGLTCILNGTPCCGTLTCKGKFPITMCKE